MDCNQKDPCHKDHIWHQGYGSVSQSIRKIWYSEKRGRQGLPMRWRLLHIAFWEGDVPWPGLRTPTRKVKSAVQWMSVRTSNMIGSWTHWSSTSSISRLVGTVRKPWRETEAKGESRWDLLCQVPAWSQVGWGICPWCEDIWRKNTLKGRVDATEIVWYGEDRGYKKRNQISNRPSPFIISKINRLDKGWNANNNNK